jgi:hypothetical protein
MALINVGLVGAGKLGSSPLYEFEGIKRRWVIGPNDRWGRIKMRNDGTREEFSVGTPV